MKLSRIDMRHGESTSPTRAWAEWPFDGGYSCPQRLRSSVNSRAGRSGSRIRLFRLADDVDNVEHDDVLPASFDSDVARNRRLANALPMSFE